MSTGPGSSTSSLKGKRKKKLPTNANPLFTQWLQEWKDEANEKGWKSAHTYGKALKTLKLFPLPLESGKDCKLLQNFGDKICKMLDEKLAQYKLIGGVLPQSSAVAPEQRSQSAKNTAGKGTVSSTAASSSSEVAPILHIASSPASVSSAASSNRQTGAHTISDDSGSDVEKECRGTPKKKRAASGSGRDYVPAYRSGPYALILSLYRTMQRPDYRGHMLKAELCEAAQPLADKSFTRPDPGSHYTAWSSMGTLIRKGLVIKYSNPAKFFLTEKGETLAERLEEAENLRDLPGAVNLRDRPGAVNPYTSSKSAVGGTIHSPASSSNHVSPGCRAFNTGDADLDAALNASLSAGSQSAHDVSDTCAAEVHASGEDADLEAALKASLQMAPQDNSADAHEGSCLHSPVVASDGSSDDRDLEAAIKASLAGSSATSSVPSKPLDTSLIDDNRSNSATRISTPKFLAQVPSPTLGGLESEDEEEEDMKKAIAESLLSYSQELSTSQCSLSEHKEIQSGKSASSVSRKNTKEPGQAQSSSSNVCDKTGGDDQAFLVISDDDDCDTIPAPHNKTILTGSPSQLIRHPHSLSPSPSPQPLPRLPRSPAADATASTKISPLSPLHLSLTSRSPSRDVAALGTDLQVVQQDGEDILVIPDGDEDNNNRKVNIVSNLPPVATAEDSEDELPDLDVPLFQRLLNKGNIQSGLLKTSAANAKQQTYQTASTSDCSGLFRGHTKEASAALSSPSASSDATEDHTLKAVKSHPYSAPSPGREDRIPRQPERAGSSSSATEGSSETTRAACNPLFTLLPGTFDIVLCLDNREFYGSKSSCKTLLPDLMKSGVQCDLRLLHVGDLLWVARERLGPQIDRVAGRELVLNYIVERKRMDDLVSSLTDGRMKEQKFRLKHCGLTDTIILIEEYGSIQNFSLSEDRIKQSIVNSQMIDGFKLKRCASTRDAVSYLAIMTRFLQQNFSSKTLHGVPVEQMKALKSQQSFHDSEQYLAPFTAFNEAAVKHKDLRVTELFAKQLIQVPGVSADRAKAITNKYPTLSLLMDAYRECDSEIDREKLLSKIKYGKNDRNLGIALSRMLHLLYTQQGALS